ncbi:hypothetical protein [Nocardioides sp. NPDC006273]|uniref:hypothetical protein n=1 Tax=Nocardioides sp. NPDC006273 TaxID=3155598 RepID=UPI0033B45011
MSLVNSLRAELFGATTKTPPFGLLLPQGWAKRPADMDALRDQVRAALERSPGVDAIRMRASLDAILAQADNADPQARERMIAWVSQVDVPVDDFVPMSMALAWIQAPAGSAMTSMAKQLVTDRGAAPLDDRGTILRWVDRVDHAVDGGTVHTVQPTYLIRVPHAPDTALMIRTTILDGGNGEHVGEQDIQTMTLLSDGIVATFRWRNDA